MLQYFSIIRSIIHEKANCRKKDLSRIMLLFRLFPQLLHVRYAREQ